MISIEQWRAAIGRWTRGRTLRPGVANFNELLLCSIGLAVISVLLMIGGVELNPGPANTIMEDLQEGQRSILESLKLLPTLVQEIAGFRETVTRLESRVVELESENKFLTRKLDYLGNQSRRNNLLFFGLEERQGESWADSVAVVRDVAAQLGVNLSDRDIERAHRTGRRRGRRPIVAKFSSYKKREEMLQAAAKYLRGAAVRVAEDHSAAVRQCRKELFPFLQKAREEGHRANMRFDKLVIDGRRYTLDQLRAGEREERSAWRERHSAGRNTASAAAASSAAVAAAADTDAASTSTSVTTTSIAANNAVAVPSTSGIPKARTAAAAAAAAAAAVLPAQRPYRAPVAAKGAGAKPSTSSRGATPGTGQQQARTRADTAPASPPPLSEGAPTTRRRKAASGRSGERPVPPLAGRSWSPPWRAQRSRSSSAPRSNPAENAPSPSLPPTGRVTRNNPTGAVASGILTTSAAAVPGCSGKADIAPQTLTLKELEDIRVAVLQFLEKQENQREFLK